mmetsp:Transcript_53306/g.86335  ORF Transcript_53306/g.86335 Transcript_53306/m.86335 type:complete len:227 (+) Transcript_53306:239-919(+)
MHQTIEEFKDVMDLMLPTWIRLRQHSILPRENVKIAAKLAMCADLLAGKSITSSANTLLTSVHSSSVSAKVFAFVEKGSVLAAAARAFQRVDGTISYIEPNKAPFCVLHLYNGPVLAARIEERPGYIEIAEVGSSEPSQPADGLACDYVKGVIFDQYSRKGIVDAIQKCCSYAALLKLLLTCGFDLGLANGDSNPRKTPGRCWRIMQGSLVLGAVWDYCGRLGCLR